MARLVSSLDIYNYLLNANSLGDFRLLDQDIVYIPQEIQQLQLLEGLEGLATMRW